MPCGRNSCFSRKHGSYALEQISKKINSCTDKYYAIETDVSEVGRCHANAENLGVPNPRPDHTQKLVQQVTYDDNSGVTGLNTVYKPNTDKSQINNSLLDVNINSESANIKFQTESENEKHDSKITSISSSANASGSTSSREGTPETREYIQTNHANTITTEFTVSKGALNVENENIETVSNNTEMCRKADENVTKNHSDENQTISNEISNCHEIFPSGDAICTDIEVIADSKNDGDMNIYVNQDIDIQQMEEVDTEEPAIGNKRRDGMRAEFINTDETTEVYAKTEEEKATIIAALQNNEFLQSVLTNIAIDQVSAAMCPRDVNDGETIINQGEDGSHMYISDFGKFEIIINGVLYKTFEDKRVFGELAILYNTPRFATIKATNKGRIWALSRKTYKTLLCKTALAEEEEIISFLKHVPAVNKASDNKLRKIASLLYEKFFKTDTVIIKQGDVGDNFFVIKSGTASVYVESQGMVKSMSRGMYFGERALIGEDRRQATVVADSPGVNCLILSRIDFVKYLGDIKTYMEEAEPEKRKSYITGPKPYNDMQLEQLKAIKTIGVGGFGRVVLVRKIQDPNILFALKYLKKHDIVKNKLINQAYNERNLQLACTSIFIVQLYKTFQDKKYVYFLLEYCIGGDVFGLMDNQPGRYFDNDRAIFIAGCTLSALEYLHERDIAYLDLKPENLVIDKDGYIKLSDFGNSIHLPRNKKTTLFSGTPEYVAPEILMNRGHDKAADYWAFGVLIYELLSGSTPFKTNDPTQIKTYSLILKGIEHVMLSSKISRTAEDLIKGLCKAHPIKRYGCQKDGCNGIKMHTWFAGFNWKKLQCKEILSPFVPNPRDKTNNGHTTKFPKDTQTPPNYGMWSGF